MSKANREAIATAASAAAGVTCHPYFVQTIDAGQALVRLERITYPNPFGGIGHYNVVVMLPQDQAAAEKYIDQKVPAICDAVAEALVITEVQPQQLNLPGHGVLPVVFINGHREE